MDILTTRALYPTFSNSESWCNCKPNPTKVNAQGRAATFPNYTDAALPKKDRPTKICAIKKGNLFNLMPTDILNVIDMWFVGLEYHDKVKDLVA